MLTGLPDGWEIKWFGNLAATGDDDADSDGLSNAREYHFQLDPVRTDTDGDTVVDWCDSEFPLLEDAAPQGGFLYTAGGDTWNWVASWWDGDGWDGAPVSPHSGTKFRVTANAAGAQHQHSYNRAIMVSVTPPEGDHLRVDGHLDSTYPPGQVMLQFYVLEENGSASWEHRAYWGADLINSGVNGTASRHRAGDLPDSGTWVRLEVPAAALGLEGKIIEGMAFSLHGGRVAWDSAGILAPDMDGDGWLDTIEIASFGGLSHAPDEDYDQDGLPNCWDASPMTYDSSAIQFQITSPAEGAQL